MSYLATKLKDLAVTLTGDAGSPQIVHLSTVDGCVDVLVQDWERLFTFVKGLIENGEQKDAVPAAPATDVVL